MKLEVVIEVPEGNNSASLCHVYNASEGLHISKKPEGAERWLLVIEVPGNLGCNRDTLQAAAAKIGKYRINKVVAGVDP